MLLTVNGEALEAPAGSTILDLLSLLKLQKGLVAVEKNREVVPRAEHDTTALQEGDVLEIVHFVGGG